MIAIKTNPYRVDDLKNLRDVLFVGLTYTTSCNGLTCGECEFRLVCAEVGRAIRYLDAKIAEKAVKHNVKG